jgi:hypothetical protein
VKDLPGALDPLWIVKLYVRRVAIDGPAHARSAAIGRAILVVNIDVNGKLGMDYPEI